MVWPKQLKCIANSKAGSRFNFADSLLTATTDGTKFAGNGHRLSWADARQQFPGLYSLVEEVDLIISEDYDRSLDEDINDKDISEGLDFCIRCLTDLAPTLEQSLAYGYRTRATIPPPIVLSEVSEPARAYISMIQQRYQSIDLKLVERLGEANWRRHVKIRKQLDESEPTPGHEYASDEAMSEGTKSTTSFLNPLSEFHDSAIGTSKSSSTRGTRSMRSSSLTRPSSAPGDVRPGTQRGIDQTMLGSKQMALQPQDISSDPTANSPMIAKSMSEFEDSAFGSSIGERIPDIMSFGSKSSSVSMNETTVARTLPMPEGFVRGKAFKCDYCGEILSKIRNRRDWRLVSQNVRDNQ